MSRCLSVTVMSSYYVCVCVCVCVCVWVLLWWVTLICVRMHNFFTCSPTKVTSMGGRGEGWQIRRGLENINCPPCPSLQGKERCCEGGGGCYTCIFRDWPNVNVHLYDLSGGVLALRTTKLCTYWKKIHKTWLTWGKRP